MKIMKIDDHEVRMEAVIGTYLDGCMIMRSGRGGLRL